MNPPFKLIIDENIGRPIGSAMAKLLSYHPNPPEIGFVVELFGGQKDHIWVPKIASEGWVILSTDRAKQSGGPKLHHVCQEHKVTHVLMSRAMHDLKQFYKAAMVIRFWDKITEVRSATAGSRFDFKFVRGVPAVIPYQRKPRNPRAIVHVQSMAAIVSEPHGQEGENKEEQQPEAGKNLA